MKLLPSAITRLLGAVALTASLASVATPAAAVPVARVTAGILTGADGVVVGAVTYNVSFVEGSCNSLFGGCVDTPSNLNFDFHTFADASAASQALFTQIISGFGNHPDKIFGCGDAAMCVIYTPGITLQSQPNGPLVVQGGRVFMDQNNFKADAFGIAAAFDTIGSTAEVYADWTIATTTVLDNNVPEPDSLALLGLGVAALGWSRRRAARPAAAMHSGAVGA